MVQVINFSEQNSCLNQYMAELRDKNYQRNRFLFRHNIKRVGEIMAYELSKTLEFKPKTITTPLGSISIPLPKDDMVIATVLRAGLPFHNSYGRLFESLRTSDPPDIVFRLVICYMLETPHSTENTDKKMP